jgi:Flp pilus assembly protein CpaB
LSKRSNLLVIVGLAVFLLGAAVVLITTHSSSSSASGGTVSVLVARQSLAAGTAGDQLVAGNLVETKNVKPSDVSAGALGSMSQLSGRTLGAAVAAGQQITQNALTASAGAAPSAAPAPSAPVGSGNLQVPAGKQALAVQIPFVPGGAQLVTPGTYVNVYANVAKGGANGVVLPCTELAMPNIEVLGASTAQQTGSATASNGAVVPAAGPDIVYVLAVDQSQAQQLIFFQKNEALYLTVVPKGQPSASTTGCTSYPEYVRK